MFYLLLLSILFYFSEKLQHDMKCEYQIVAYSVS